MKIYLDFDGTMVEHKYPMLGAPNHGAVDVVKKLQGASHKIILNTYRANLDDGLEEAINYLKGNGIEIDRYVGKKVSPSPWDWEFFEVNDLIYIDDICDGIPMRRTKFIQGGWMVDWNELDRQFSKKEIY